MERRSLKKNQGFNGIQTRDLRDTGAMLYQLNYEATHWERGQFIELIHCISHEEWNDVKYIWNNSFHIYFTSFQWLRRLAKQRFVLFLLRKDLQEIPLANWVFCILFLENKVQIKKTNNYYKMMLFMST